MLTAEIISADISLIKNIMSSFRNNNFSQLYIILVSVLENLRLVFNRDETGKNGLFVATVSNSDQSSTTDGSWSLDGNSHL